MRRVPFPPPLVCFAALTAGCAAASSRADVDADLARSRRAIAPDAEPAPPRVNTDGKVAFNTEYYLGTADEEAAQFARFSDEIQRIQATISADRGQPIQRGFHAKGHACLRGEFVPAPNRDARTRFGVFARDEAHPVWVRFSNGVGWKQDDSSLDARGMAIKMMGIPGPKYLPDESGTQDFLMTNSPTPVGRDAVEFMKFAEANTSGRLAGVFFLATHPRTGGPALLRTSPIDSLITEQYWSGGAYHLGAHQAVKYTARPCEGVPARHPDRGDDDYLRADLKAAAAAGICMSFYVQFQTDPEETPIENASVEWDSPLVYVGNVLLPPTTSGFSEDDLARCDGLSFSPWHAIPAHKPMGHINRARRYVYAASARFRHGGGEPRP